MLAVLKILGDVALYRLRNREMANLAASLTIMVALALPGTEIAVRLLFAVVLNLSVYLTNDLYDIDLDLESPGKDQVKAHFLAAHPRAAQAAQGLLLATMAAIGAAWSHGLLVTMALGVGLCWAYSAQLKRVAFVDVTVIGICGTVGVMVAFPLDSALGWCLAGQLGLYSASFQCIQLVRDRGADERVGNRTTAVVLGLSRTVLLQRALLALSALYTMLLLHRWLGLALVVAAMLPFDVKQAAKHWNRVRLVLGLGWLAVIAVITAQGAGDGFLLSVDRSRLLSLLSSVR